MKKLKGKRVSTDTTNTGIPQRELISSTLFFGVLSILLAHRAELAYIERDLSAYP